MIKSAIDVEIYSLHNVLVFTNLQDALRGVTFAG